MILSAMAVPKQAGCGFERPEELSQRRTERSMGKTRTFWLVSAALHPGARWPPGTGFMIYMHSCALPYVPIRWCPAHKGVASNEKADQWGKVAVGEPGAHGLEWL